MSRLVTFAAQFLGQRDLAQARAGVPGVGDDAPGGCDELGVTVAGVQIVLPIRFRFGRGSRGSRDGTGRRASVEAVPVEAGCMCTVVLGGLCGDCVPRGRVRGIGAGAAAGVEEMKLAMAA